MNNTIGFFILMAGAGYIVYAAMLYYVTKNAGREPISEAEPYREPDFPKIDPNTFNSVFTNVQKEQKEYYRNKFNK